MKLRLRDLKGLGPKSEASLQEIGISSPDELKRVGAVRAFINLRQRATVKPSLNFLYAMVGALEDRHWREIAETERTRLFAELDSYAERQKQLQHNDAGT